MTIETCRVRLEIAKRNEDADEVAFWEERLARKMGKQEVVVEEKQKKGVKKDGS